MGSGTGDNRDSWIGDVVVRLLYVLYQMDAPSQRYKFREITKGQEEFCPLFTANWDVYRIDRFDYFSLC